MSVFVATAALLGSAAAHTVQAAPKTAPDGTETTTTGPCIAPNGDERPQLQGTLKAVALPYKAAVGQNVQIAMEGATLVIPSKRCADESSEIAVPQAAWALIARPAASTATIAAVTRSGARVTPDVAGRYRVRFTACPNGCTIQGQRVPAISREVGVTAIDAATTRLSSDEFSDLLLTGLRGTRIQLSQTANGVVRYGTPYTVEARIPAYKYDQLTNCDRFTGMARETCERSAEAVERKGTVSLVEVTPTLNSYIDFTKLVEDNGAPPLVELPLTQFEAEVPFAARWLLTGGTSTAFVASVDVDRVRLSLNNIRTVVGQTADGEGVPASASIGDGKVKLSTTMKAGSPAVVCEGHYQVKVGFFVTLTSGWADSLCPDFNLQPITVDVALTPRVDSAGQLFIGQPDVSLGLKPRGISSILADYFGDLTGRAARRAEPLVEQGLEHGAARPLAKAVEAFIKRDRMIDDLGPILSATVVGDELVVVYERVAPQAPTRPPTQTRPQTQPQNARR